MRPQLAALGLMLALGGCEGTAVPQVKLNPNIGNAVSHNISAHTVDPEPAWAEKTDLETLGIRAEKAMRAYRGGEEKKPEAVSTK